ncbi:MAG: thermonuclease family protein [Rhizobiaceae bacterium]
MWRFGLFLALSVACPPPAAASQIVPGPVEARVLRVIDGDSFVAEARVWPGHTVTVSVRIRGIDAPEMKSRCEAERQAAKRSRAALEAMIGAGPVAMTNIGGGKFYGRVVADVTTPDGRAVAPAMITGNGARLYAGGKRRAWCG